MHFFAQPPLRARAPEEGPGQIAWLDVLLSLSVMLVCFFYGVRALGLLGPDEPRYAAIARDMARTGDWVTPRLAGQPWFEKPILFYWLAGEAYRWFGDGELAMRLPSILAAILATMAAAWAGLRAFGTLAARLTLLMLPATVAMIGLAHSAGFDMLFAAFLMISAAAAAEMLERRRAQTPFR